MRTSFYEKIINTLEKAKSTTREEKFDKSEMLVTISIIIGKRGGSVTWDKKKKKWIVNK